MAPPSTSALALALPAAALLAVSGMVALRLGWGRRQRGMSAMGWAMLAGSAWAGAAAGGAWGVAVASLWGMGAALALIGWAAWQAPAPAAARTPRAARTLPPPPRLPLRIGGRMATFATVVIGGLLASAALGLAAHGLTSLAGAGEANANVAMLYTLPVAWAVLAHLLMTASSRAQGAIIAACLVTAVPALL